MNVFTAVPTQTDTGAVTSQAETLKPPKVTRAPFTWLMKAARDIKRQIFSTLHRSATENKTTDFNTTSRFSFKDE